MLMNRIVENDTTGQRNCQPAGDLSQPDQASRAEGKPEQSPPGQCEQGGETACESGRLMIDILRERRSQDQALVLIAHDGYSQMLCDGNFVSECCL